LGNAFEPSTWRAWFEILSLKGTPQGGEGSDTGSVSGQKIVDGVADKDCFVRAPTQPMER